MRSIPRSRGLRRRVHRVIWVGDDPLYFVWDRCFINWYERWLDRWLCAAHIFGKSTGAANMDGVKRLVVQQAPHAGT